MKVFVIHRFVDRSKAKKKLKQMAREKSLELHPIFLDSSGGGQWKVNAIKAIEMAEVVIVFNKELCEESDNAKWEIKKTTNAGKEIIYIHADSNEKEVVFRIKSIYNMTDEFDSCFTKETNNYFELYKLMLLSSENLIQRRQRTNAFFITVIGSLLAIAGLFVKNGAISGDSLLIIFGFSAVGLLLCNSWWNLIDNYGKLNKAKYDVILRLEKELGALIYTAEWVALGKGMRPRKYKSFTSTEKNVPIYFGILIIIPAIAAVVWKVFEIYW